MKQLLIVSLLALSSFSAFSQTITLHEVTDTFCYKQQGEITFKTDGNFPEGQEFILYQLVIDGNRYELGRTTGNSFTMSSYFSSNVVIETPNGISSNIVWMNIDKFPEYSLSYLSYQVNPECDGSENKIEIKTTSYSDGNFKTNFDESIWEKDGKIVARNKALFFEAKENGVYEAFLKRGQCIYSVSNKAEIKIQGIPQVSIQNYQPIICEGSSTELSVLIPENSDLEVQWFMNGDSLLETKSKRISASKSGNYTVQVSDKKGCKSTSSPFPLSATNLKVEPIIANTIPIENGIITLCESGTTILQFAGNYYGETSFKIDWLKDGKYLENEHQFPNWLAANEPGIYRYKLSQGNCEVLSEPVTIKTGNMKAFKVRASNSSFLEACEGQSIELFAEYYNENELRGIVSNLTLMRDDKVVQEDIKPWFASIKVTESGNYYLKGEYRWGNCPIYSDTTKVAFHKTGVAVPFDIYSGFLENHEKIMKVESCGASTVLNMGKSLNKSGFYSDPVSYNWTYNGSGIENGKGESLKVNHSGIYQLEINLGDQCTYLSKPLEVSLHTFDVKITNNFDGLCANHLNELSVQFPSQNTRFQNSNGNGGYYYKTYPEFKEDIDLQWFQDGNPLGKSFNQTIAEEGNYSLQVKYDGCETTTSLKVDLIEINPEIITPKLLCPDGSVKLETMELADNYFWLNQSLKSSENSPKIETKNAGEYKVWLEKGGCGQFSETVVVKEAELATATISGNTTIGYGESTEISVDFTGTGPWAFTTSDGQSLETNTSPYALAVSPALSETFTITALTGQCGSGESFGEAHIEVLVLGTEENDDMFDISVYPNPTASKIKIDLREAPQNEVSLQLYNMSQKLLLETKFEAQETELSLQNLPYGTYILKVILDEKVTVRKIIKGEN